MRAEDFEGYRSAEQPTRSVARAKPERSGGDRPKYPEKKEAKLGRRRKFSGGENYGLSF